MFQLHTHQNDCKTAEKLLFCGVCWHFTANQTMIRNNSTTRSSLPMNLCMPFEYYETKRWAKIQLHNLQNDCKIAEKLLFCGVWNISRQTRTMIPSNSTTRSSLPIKLCMPFKYYETKRWAKFQLHTLQNDCKIAEKLLFGGVCWHFTANKDHDPQQLNNQIVSGYETLHAF